MENSVNYPRKIWSKNFEIPWTTPVGGSEFYEKRITERFEFSPSSKSNYLKYLAWMEQGDKTVQIDFAPISGHVNPNSQCNFRCVMCSVSDFRNGKRCDDMSLELFEKRLDQLQTLIEISLTGLSELFMMHDGLEEMLRMCVSKKIWTKISTNGSLLHQRNWIERIVNLNLDEITISIDGVTKETFESIRRKSNFERVIKNTIELNEAFYKAGITPKRTKMVTVLQTTNWAQLFDFVPFAKNLGFTSIAFSLEPFDWGSRSWTERNSKISGILSEDEASKLVSQGMDYGIEVGFVELVQRYVAESKNSSLCSWPFSKIFISSDDRVVPCCHISNPDHFEIGSGIGESNTVSDIWFGDDYNRFRQSHLSGNIPDACKSCYK